MRFSTFGSSGTQERMRIDSSGNLLVGKTVTTYNTAGISLYAGGAGQFTASGNRAMYLNRLSTDGDILQFDKDGTTVGSIGAKSGSLLIGSTDTYLRINDPSDTIFPSDSAGLERDNAVNLGKGSSRFKDLYLSGGVYLGGTGSANKLDDYEEGTWTPVLGGTSGNPTTTYSEQHGRYVKIGSAVFVWFRLTIATRSGGAGTATINGLPFTMLDDPAMQANSGGMIDQVSSDSRQVSFQGAPGSNHIIPIQNGGSTGSHGGFSPTEFQTNSDLRAQFMYIISS
jgi:hypothetical protein